MRRRPPWSFAPIVGAAMVAAVAGAAGAAPFRVYQFALNGSPLSVKSCAECGSATAPTCQPWRIESVPFADYAKNRWVAPRGVRLIGNDCVADAADLLLGKSGVALAAIRLADDPPRQALLDLSPKAPPSVVGWPTPPTRRQGSSALSPAPRTDPSLLRLAAVCWPAVDGWPVPSDRAGADALASLDPKNPCEWWLLPFKARGAAGELEPDLTSRSYLVVPNSREEWRGRFAARRNWPELFSADQARSIEDALEAGWDAAPTASDAALAATAGAMAAAASPSAPPARPAASKAGAAQARGAAPAACPAGIDAANPAVFGRFAAWADRFGVSAGGEEAWRPSRWQGRCGAYEVLRSALEERLGCRLDVEACGSANAQTAGATR